MRIDAHSDTAVKLLKKETLRFLPEETSDYWRLSQQLDVAFFAIFLDKLKYGNNLVLKGLSVLDRLLCDLDKNSDLVRPLLWREQLLENNNISLILIALEGGELLGEKAELLPLFYRLGLRSLGLTWNYRNQLADGCFEDGGLTRLGREVVKSCNKMGILLDGAHISKKGFYELVEISEKPLIISHTACYDLHPHRRNLDNKQLKTIAENNGVIGITFVRDFLGGGKSLQTVVEHIIHATEIAGVDHVGLGSDYDGAVLADGLTSIDDLPVLRQSLSDNGFNEAEIGKISGGNIKRILLENLKMKDD